MIHSEYYVYITKEKLLKEEEFMDSYESAVAALTGVFLIALIVGLVLGVYSLVCMWKVFSKAGVEGWKAIIPIYNMYIMSKISTGNGWFFLLLLIPYVNLVMAVIILYKLCKSFGKGAGFCVGLIFLYPIFIGILAFSKNIKYTGVK